LKTELKLDRHLLFEHKVLDGVIPKWEELKLPAGQSLEEEEEDQRCTSLLYIWLMMTLVWNF